MELDPQVLDSPGRLAVIRGKVLDRELDEELQSIVTQAAEELRFPIAMVSLVLRRMQFFRAHVGLPPELAVSRCTDREMSFCQFAVSSGKVLQIEDAKEETWLPQAAVERLGVRAYVGVPLALRGQPVGTLCLIDVVPRTVTPEQIDVLQGLAGRAASRLESLASNRPPSPPMLAKATRPAFLEIRNLLNSVDGDIDYLGMVLTEVEGVMALFRNMNQLDDEQLARATGAIESTVHCYDDLRGVQSNLQAACTGLIEQILSLETSLQPEGDRVRADAVASTAAQLARHFTRNVGGFTWDVSDLEVGASLANVSAVVAAGLAALAQQLPQGAMAGLEMKARLADGMVHFRLSAPDADVMAYRRAAADLEGPCASQPYPTLAAEPDALALAWPAA